MTTCSCNNVKCSLNFGWYEDLTPPKVNDANKGKSLPKAQPNELVPLGLVMADEDLLKIHNKTYPPPITAEQYNDHKNYEGLQFKISFQDCLAKKITIQMEAFDKSKPPTDSSKSDDAKTEGDVAPTGGDTASKKVEKLPDYIFQAYLKKSESNEKELIAAEYSDPSPADNTEVSKKGSKNKKKDKNKTAEEAKKEEAVQTVDLEAGDYYWHWDGYFNFKATPPAFSGDPDEFSGKVLHAGYLKTHNFKITLTVHFCDGKTAQDSKELSFTPKIPDMAWIDAVILLNGSGGATEAILKMRLSTAPGAALPPGSLYNRTYDNLKTLLKTGLEYHWRRHENNLKLNDDSGWKGRLPISTCDLTKYYVPGGSIASMADCQGIVINNSTLNKNLSAAKIFPDLDVMVVRVLTKAEL